jgi:hypothetical protein
LAAIRAGIIEVTVILMFAEVVEGTSTCPELVLAGWLFQLVVESTHGAVTRCTNKALFPVGLPGFAYTGAGLPDSEIFASVIVALAGIDERSNLINVLATVGVPWLVHVYASISPTLLRSVVGLNESANTSDAAVIVAVVSETAVWLVPSPKSHEYDKPAVDADVLVNAAVLPHDGTANENPAVAVFTVTVFVAEAEHPLLAVAVSVTV